MCYPYILKGTSLRFRWQARLVRGTTNPRRIESLPYSMTARRRARVRCWRMETILR